MKHRCLIRYKTIFDFLHLPPCAGRLENDTIHTRSPSGADALFENRKLEIKENYNSYNEIGWIQSILSEENFLLSVYGRTTDALASVGYEGRGRLR